MMNLFFAFNCPRLMTKMSDESLIVVPVGITINGALTVMSTLILEVFFSFRALAYDEGVTRLALLVNLLQYSTS